MQRMLLVAIVFASTLAQPVQAHYYRRSAPEYAPNNQPIMNVGEIRVDQGTPGMLVGRSFTSADFKCTSDRWGTHTVHFFWDGPPDFLVPGQKFTTQLGWSIAQKWSQFSPIEGGLSHLDWNNEQYLRSLRYGYGDGDAPASGYDKLAFTVPVDHDPPELAFYTDVHCAGASARVKWTYKKVEGNAPAGAATTTPSETPATTAATTPSGNGWQGTTKSSWHVPAGNTGTESLTAPPEPVAYRNGADGGVSNGVTVPTTFTISRPLTVTQIMTYHYAFKGKPGTITLRHSDGTTFGPWTAAGAGSASLPNVYWWVRPNVTLKPGTWTVIDSDPASWSHEAATHGAGIVQIWGK